MYECIISKSDCNDNTKHIMNCSHHNEFHEECIIEWANTDNICPLCRVPLKITGNKGNEEIGPPLFFIKLMDYIALKMEGIFFTPPPNTLIGYFPIFLKMFLFLCFSMVFVVLLLLPILLITVFPFTEFGDKVCKFLTTIAVFYSAYKHGEHYYDFVYQTL